MTNEEYIRKAVELADGWDLADEQVDCPLGCAFRLPLQIVVLDALAAQLVRQCDELGSQAYADALIFGMGYEDQYNTGDRSISTIKLVLDSGVLK